MSLDFSLANILCGIFFGMIGMIAWRHGRKQVSGRHMILGVALMSYSYFISNDWLLAILGIVMTVLLFWP